MWVTLAEKPISRDMEAEEAASCSQAGPAERDKDTSPPTKRSIQTMSYLKQMQGKKKTEQKLKSSQKPSQLVKTPMDKHQSPT